MSEEFAIKFLVNKVYLPSPPLHSQKVSTLQEFVQPSLLIKFPSSHSSRPTRIPSPHIGFHILESFTTVQWNPFMTFQLLFHP